MTFKGLKGNIPKEYIFTIFFNLDLTRGLWMIYLASRGFSLIHLGILESIFHTTSFLMEIPTGAVADIWGRKTSRIIGRVFYLISLMLLFLSTNFLFQLIGFIICSIGYNLESGAGEALLYDSLDTETKETQYMSIAGKKEFVLQCSCIVSLIIGGYIATRSYNYVFGLSIFVVIMSILTALTFVEPNISKSYQKSMNILVMIKEQTLNSFKVILEKKQIAFFIIFSELIFSFTVSLFFYLQNFWVGIGFTEFHIGIIFAIASLLTGLTGLFTHKIEKWIGGPKGIVLIVPLFVILALWGIAFTEYKHIFYMFIGLMEGLLYVAISDYINKQIPPEYRATVLSFQSMVFSFFMIMLFPIIGWIGDNYGLNFAFVLISITASIIAMIYFLNYGIKKIRDS